MKKIIFLCLSLIILLSCSSSNKVDNSQKPFIKLFVHPRQGFVPLTVVMEGELINFKEEEKKFKCLVEEWDFGDGSKSYYQPDCSKEADVKTKFLVTHTYYSTGTYRVQLTLGKNVIRSQVARINVFSSGL